MLAACAARRWLARTAAGVKLIKKAYRAPAAVYISLVSCLPALEVALLSLASTSWADLACLLEALAWCPRLSVLKLYMPAMWTKNYHGVDSISDVPPLPAPGWALAFAKLRSLTKLTLECCILDSMTLAEVVDALVPVAGLAELSIQLFKPVVVPAALGQLKCLRSLAFRGLKPCALEAGCLHLPNLQRIDFQYCWIEDAEMLLGMTALESLRFAAGRVPPIFAQLVKLPLLRRVLLGGSYSEGGACLGLARLPADMGALRSSLLHLDIGGHKLPTFPLALTQLVALECLHASGNDFAELPAGVTALSRLTELELGRVRYEDALQLCGKRPLDVRALGDLSGFPALCRLRFYFCEVMLCRALLGAVRHARLAALAFIFAHPAPECALVVLQLGQALMTSRPGSVLRSEGSCDMYGRGHGRGKYAQAPFNKFKAALKECGCEVRETWPANGCDARDYWP